MTEEQKYEEALAWVKDHIDFVREELSIEAFLRYQLKEKDERIKELEAHVKELEYSLTHPVEATEFYY